MNRPTFNHSRGDGPYNPCPECAAQMSKEDLLAVIRDMQSVRDADREEEHPASTRRLFLGPMTYWGSPGALSDPIGNIRSLQAMAPVRPVRFEMSEKTAMAFLDNQRTIRFAKEVGSVDVLERRSSKFTFRGLADFEVVDMPDGIVRMVDTTSSEELARLEGALEA